MTYTIPPTKLPFTQNTAFDFTGGDLTSDGGLLVLHEFCTALGIKEHLMKELIYHPLRKFDDACLVFQKAMLICAGYCADDDATELREDPAFSYPFGSLASQETISRRFSAMGQGDVVRLRRALDSMFADVASRDERTECVIDIDTTLLDTFGQQDSSAFNHHYSKVGLHPTLATDTIARDVVGFELRPMRSSTSSIKISASFEQYLEPGLSSKPTTSRAIVSVAKMG